MAHLTAIINVWDGRELLRDAVINWWRCGVDSVIIIYSNLSNYGEDLNNTVFLSAPWFRSCKIYNCEPIHGMSASDNETVKRNYGLLKAREMGATHFIMADCDEFYDPAEFRREWNELQSPNRHVAGMCCASTVYFKRPTLSIGVDVTIVPFIHALAPEIRHGFNRAYPFAFAGNQIRIDPTRQLNITRGVLWSNIMMHHFSWVRDDISRKIRNSSARMNIERTDVREEYRIAEAGYFLKFYRRTLYTVENKFNIPHYGCNDMGQDVSHGGKSAAPADPLAER